MVEIEADKVEKKVNEAYRALAKKAKIPGFRPGKIPRNILESYFGNQVQEDVTKDLVSESLPTAVEETNTYPLTMPVVENDLLKIGQDFKYSATMEVKPEFTLPDYMGLAVEKEIIAVKDEDVKTQLEAIRKNQGNLISVEEDRGVKEGDYTVLEYEAFEGEKALEGIKSDNFLLNVGSGEFHTDFEKALIGLNKGDSTEIGVNFDDKYFNPKLAGKAVRFKVNITDLKSMDLPALDDDFARSLGPDFTDLKILEEKIKEDLIKRETTRIDRDVKRRLLKKLSDGVDFTLPESLVELEIRQAFESLKQNLARSGSNMEKAGLNEEKLKKDFKPASEKRVKEMLILGEIAKQDELTVEETDLTEGFREMADSIGQDPEAVRRYYEANQLMESFKERLLEEKTLNYLVKGAKVMELEADKIEPEKE
jgi:trigger factor